MFIIYESKITDYSFTIFLIIMDKNSSQFMKLRSFLPIDATIFLISPLLASKPRVCSATCSEKEDF